jgi:serine/threonine protein kinase
MTPPDLKKKLIENIEWLNSKLSIKNSNNSYICNWKLNNEYVVIKVLKPVRDNWKDITKNEWIWEVEVLKKINSVNKNTSTIIWEWNINDKYYYIILRKYDGDLYYLMKNYNISDKLNFVCNLFHTIGWVIKSLKEIQIIHQDIKPKNIFYKKNKTSYEFFLWDFWLNTSYKSRIKTTMKWNKNYYAPEQLDDSYIVYWWWLTHKADLFPLWIIAFEILSWGHFSRDLKHAFKYENYWLKEDIIKLLISLTEIIPNDRINIDTFLNELENHYQECPN